MDKLLPKIFLYVYVLIKTLTLELYLYNEIITVLNFNLLYEVLSIIKIVLFLFDISGCLLRLNVAGFIYNSQKIRKNKPVYCNLCPTFFLLIHRVHFLYIQEKLLQNFYCCVVHICKIYFKTNETYRRMHYYSFQARNL